MKISTMFAIAVATLVVSLLTMNIWVLFSNILFGIGFFGVMATSLLWISGHRGD